MKTEGAKHTYPIEPPQGKRYLDMEWRERCWFTAYASRKEKLAQLGRTLESTTEEEDEEEDDEEDDEEKPPPPPP